MPFRHGKNTNFQLGTAGTPGTPADISGYLVEVQFPGTTDLAESTTFSASTTGVDKTYQVGLRDHTITLSGLFDPAIDAQLSAILGLDGPFAFVYGPEGLTAGRTKYTGNCLMENYQPTNPVGDRVAWTAALHVTGAVTRGVY